MVGRGRNDNGATCVDNFQAYFGGLSERGHFVNIVTPRAYTFYFLKEASCFQDVCNLVTSQRHVRKK